MHGSPYHVYPTNNYPAVQAFQGPSAAPAHLQQQFYPAHNGSPMLATKFQQQMVSPPPGFIINNVAINTH